MRQRFLACLIIWGFSTVALAHDQKLSTGTPEVAINAPSEKSFSGPGFEPDGTVNVSEFQLPPSPLTSKQAQEQQAMRARMPVAMANGPEPDIATRRAQLNTMMGPRVDAMRRDFAVTEVDAEIGGVPVKIFTPSDREPFENRILINLHGGAFNVCWPVCAQIESIPIAAMGGYKVVSVDYRMAPENKHPAGVEDAASVYRALLEQYAAKNIGVFGCSAGGALTAQLAAWLPANDMPQMGAAGIFGAGAVRIDTGDSHFIAAAIDGSFGPPRHPQAEASDLTRGYFDGADMDGPIVGAARHPDVMAKFPPSLLITGTRAIDMSPAIYTNSRLLKAGVKSTLIVGEGMGHCYLYSYNLPESKDAYDLILRFFAENLE